MGMTAQKVGTRGIAWVVLFIFGGLAAGNTILMINSLQSGSTANIALQLVTTVVLVFLVGWYTMTKFFKKQAIAGRA